MISPAEIGARGNSHMIMQDQNYLQVAELILAWIDERVSKRRVEKQRACRGPHGPVAGHLAWCQTSSKTCRTMSISSKLVRRPDETPKGRL